MTSLNDVLIEAGLKEARKPKYEKYPRRNVTMLVTKHVNMKTIEKGEVDAGDLMDLTLEITRLIHEAYAEGHDIGFEEGEKEGREKAKRQ